MQENTIKKAVIDVASLLIGKCSDEQGLEKGDLDRLTQNSCVALPTS